MGKWFRFCPVLIAFILWAGLGARPLSAEPAERECIGAAVGISAPQPGSTVQGQIAIRGSAALPGGEFRYYKVEYTSAGQNAWVVITDGVRLPVLNGTLAIVNADLLPSGDYTLRVLVVDRTGNYCEAYASPIHVGQTSAQTPTPDSSATPPETSAPNPNATSAPTSKIQAAGGDVAQGVRGTPTLSIQIPTVQPGTDALMTQGKGSGNALPSLPVAELTSAGTSILNWAGSLGHAFVFGMQLTAGTFILLGAIVFLRRNL